MATISLTAGGNTVSTTVSAADAARILAAITHDRNATTTTQQALAFSLQTLMNDLISRTLAYEASLAPPASITSTPPA